VESWYLRQYPFIGEGWGYKKFLTQTRKNSMPILQKISGLLLIFDELSCLSAII